MTWSASDQSHTPPGNPPINYVSDLEVSTNTYFDRIEVTSRLEVQDWSVGYVDQLYHDGSGEPANLVGSADVFLQIVLRGVNAHTGGGAPTILLPTLTWFYPQIREHVMLGDFEATVTFGLGLRRKAPFRVTTAKDRFTVDIRHG